MNKKTWNPYISGALAGLLLVLSLLIAGKFLGASTTFARSAAVIEKTVGIDTSKFEYFTTKKGKYGPASLPNWQLLFVIGIIVGSFIS
ncbi:MAG: YeeE/YedE thiosulfate transporter family protein, partial [Thermodesulfobacteriota bacterium]|nr:YeeE/YedE thiosulfate transporter family protein [Thermodesulfobacteriota bacterium]